MAACCYEDCAYFDPSVFQNLVKSGSGLLNETQRKSWNDLEPEQREKSATSLIVSLEQMALEVAATIDKPETVTSTEQNIGNHI